MTGAPGAPEESGKTPDAEPRANPVEEAVQRARDEEGDAQPQSRPVNKGGRPRGAKDARPRKRPEAGRAAPTSEPEAPPAEPTPAELAGIAATWRVVWMFLARSGRFRPITQGEAEQLAPPTVPVLTKYASSYAEYAPEIGLGMAVVGMAMLTMVNNESSAPEAAAVQPSLN